jgi:hypothetical protein
MGLSSLFAVLILERDPFTFENLPGLFQAWLIDTGGFALVGLIIYLLYALLTPTENIAGSKERAGVPMTMVICLIISMLLYGLGIGLIATGRGEDPTKIQKIVEPGYTYRYEAPELNLYPRALVTTCAGAFAIIGIGLPFFKACLKIRFGRIFAVAKLSFLEMVRNKVYYIFLAALFVFFVPTKWFNNSIMPEDELRSIFSLPYIIIQVICLILALILSSFSVPNDINRQTIYTLVTKPMERLELLFGRFAGYLFGITLGLVAMSLLGVLFISSTKINEKAKEESYLARVPLRGKLEFKSRRGEIEGTNVGREFDYRKYIAGDPASSQRAVWNYNSVPSGLANQPDGVKCEFTFDIFRLTKGEENKGVFCQFVFATHQCGQEAPKEDRDGFWKWTDKAKEEEYKKEAVRLLSEATGREQNTDSIKGVLGGASPNSQDPVAKKVWAAAETLAEKFGYFEVPSVEVYDFHPASVIVPQGIFKNAREGTPAKNQQGKATPRLKVFVKCESRSQLLGMAQGDLYIIEGVNTFEANYLRSMFGLWCRIAIMITLGLCISTYFSGVVTMIVTLVTYGLGYAAEHLDDVARGTSAGGGPAQSFISLMRAEQATAEPSENPFLKGFDGTYRWILQRLKNILPDLDGFGWSHFVKEGFNVNYEFLTMNLICLVGYLIPWFVLGYYLLRSREVADT